MFVRPPGTTDSMQIVFIFVGKVVIDDGLHIVHVDAAGSHISRDQDGKLAALEIPHDLIAPGLGNVSMETLRFVSFLAETARQFVCHKLCIAKDHDSVINVRVQEIEQVICFLILFGGDDVLRDLRPVGLGGFDGNLYRIVLILPGDRQDILVGSGREKNQLPIRRCRLDDLRYILDKAHVQHFIRFIQHHCVDRGKRNISTLHMIQQAAGRRYDNLRTALQRCNLPGDRLAAIDNRDSYTLDIFCQACQFLSDLQGQFAGWSQDDFLHTAVLQLDVFQHRNAKGACLAGARRSNGVDVRAGHHQGDGAGLDG